MDNETEADRMRRDDERREAATRAMHQWLLDTPTGRPFGCGDDAANFYILSMNPAGSADLYRYDGIEVSDCLAFVDSSMWHNVGQTALFDFNFRLADKSAPAGSWPERGGTVRLHPCFGRELEIAMILGSESFQNAPTLVKAWAELKVATRQAMWKRWKSTIDTDPANHDDILIRLFHEVSAREFRKTRERKTHVDALHRYVVLGERDALDVAFGDPRALGMDAQMWLKRLSPTIYMIDTPETRVERTKLVRDALASAEARRAAIAQMVEAA